MKGAPTEVRVVGRAVEAVGARGAQVRIPSAEPDAFHARSLPFAAATAAGPLAATSNSEQASVITTFRMSLPLR